MVVPRARIWSNREPDLAITPRYQNYDAKNISTDGKYHGYVLVA